MKLPALVATLLLLAAPAVARRHQEAPPDLGAIDLPLADPTLAATIAGIPATLAVSLDARDTIELSPPLAARADVPWQKGDIEEIGRVTLPTRLGAGLVTLGGVRQPMALTTHDRPCCRGHDGELSPVLLPWSTIRFGSIAPDAQSFPARFTGKSGLYVPMQTPRGMIRLILSPERAETVATASAGAILARLYGGQFVGEGHEVPIAFGVSRLARDMRFATPPRLLGMPLVTVAVRLADYGGGRALPESEGGDIVVKGRAPPDQHDWPEISIGRDLLGRCTGIEVLRDQPAVVLSCPAS